MSDMITARMVVAVLAIVAFICLGGLIYLSATHNPVPDALVATLGAAVGALAGVLAPKSGKPDV